MNKNTKIILSIIIVAIVGYFVYLYIKNKVPEVGGNTPIVVEDSILGCYVARIEKDVYTMQIASQNGKNVSGTLNFKNFEKDSSSGSLIGTYENGILLGEYAFRSEGMDSVMEVIFKKSGDDFVRGYGEFDAEEGTSFKDLNNITYDSSSALAVFKNEICTGVNN